MSSARNSSPRLSMVGPPPEGRVRQTTNRLRESKVASMSALFVASLILVAVFADLLASDLPVAGRFHGALYLLPAITRPVSLADEDCTRLRAEKSAGDFAIEPLVAYGPAAPGKGEELHVLAAPGALAGHPLGTDAKGRDVFARVVHGARTSLTVSLLAVLGCVLFGTLLGGMAGFFRGPLDSVVARLVETLSAFPTILLALVVQTLLPHPTSTSMLVAIALTRWPEITRLVRAEVMLVTSQEHILAARALGASPWRVLFRHVTPNVQGPIIVAAALSLPAVVLLEASLAFLNVGVPAPTASWGETLAEARTHLEAWWLLLVPGLMVLFTTAALNFLGEWLRDLLDPRLRLEDTSVLAKSSSRTLG